MSKVIFRREELIGATLRLGTAHIELADYATTGLRVVAVGPSGIGKTNAGFAAAEQLARQGWVSVIVDPEGEAAALYGKPVRDAGELALLLRQRTRPIVVVQAEDASAFVPFGQAILAAADEHRRPIFLMLDEGQLFSASRKRLGEIGASSDLVNDFGERGRKRSLDLFLTAHRFSGSLHRSMFANKNLTLIGRQEDPTAWSALAQQFRGTNLGYQDLMALGPGEFMCFSRRGVEKIHMQMSDALAKVAPKARLVQPALPGTFSQWDRALRAIPTARLAALSPELVSLMAAIAGLTPQQLASGQRALADELEDRG